MTVLRKAGKVLLWLLGILVGLLLLVFILLQIPAFQNFLKDRAVGYLEKKIGTRVVVDNLAITFPKKIVLDGVYFEDQKKDTLLAGRRIAADVALFELLKSKVVVKNLEFEGIRANIYRKDPDSNFNFQYIVDAFDNGSKTTPTDTTGGLEFDLNRISLKQTVTTFQDDRAGMQLYASLGNFEMRVREFNPDRMRYALPSILLTDANATIRQYKPLVAQKSEVQRERESNEPTPLVLKLANIELKRVKLDYQNQVQDVAANFDVGAFSTKVDTMDLQKLYIGLDRLALSNTQAVIRLGPTPAAQVVAQETGEEVAAQANNPWKILAGNVNLTDVNLKYDNDGDRRASEGMDYSHLDVQNLLLDANNLALTPSRTEGSVERMEVEEKNSRFRLLKLNTDFVYNDSGINLNNLYLQTDKTILQDRIVVGWPSLKALSRDPGVMIISGNLRNSRLAARDIITFAPMVRNAPPFEKAPDAVFNIHSLNVAGRLHDLRINSLDISGLTATRVRATGTVRGWPDPVNTVYNLKIDHLASTAADFDKFIPRSAPLPDNIRIPETFAMTGNFTGKVNDFRSDFNAKTSRGNARGQLAMRNFGEGAYSINAITDNLNLGWITKQEATMGKVSAKVTATGAGFDMAKSNADFKAEIYSALFNGYTYRNVNATGKLRQGILDIKGTSKDANLGAGFALNIDLRGKTPLIKGDVTMSSLDLYALGFSPTPFRIDGDVKAHISSADPDNPLVNVAVRNGKFNVNGQKFEADYLNLDTRITIDSGYVVQVRSDAVTADMYGHFGFTKVAPSVMALVNRYYNLPDYRYKATPPQDFVLNATLLPSPLLFGFVPDMKGSEPVNIYTAFNSSTSLLDARVQTPRLYWQENRIDSVNLMALTADSALNYDLNFKGIHSKTMHIYRTGLNGAVANNVVDFNLRNEDMAEKTRYIASGDVTPTAQNGFRLALNPEDSLLLNYEPWTVAPDNALEYSKAGIVAQNFALSKGEEQLGLYSLEPNPQSPIELRFAKFRISTLTDFAGQSDLNLEGQVNGAATVQNVFAETPYFSSDLRIDDLIFNQDTIGTVLVQADNAGSEAISANISLNGYGNDMRLNGVYYLAGEKVDMNLNIGNFNMARLPGLSMGQVAEGGGSLTGSVDVLGTLSDPDVNGSLHFDSVYVIPTMLGAKLYVPSDNIFITPQGIRFDRFTVLDSASNKMVVDGNIFSTDYKNYRFGMTVNADNFLIANAHRRAGSDQMFYGRLNLTTDTRIGGTLKAPEVTGNVRINDGTDFSVLLPSTNPEVDAGVGVVQFVDKDNPDNAGIITQQIDTLTGYSSVSGVQADFNFTTDSAARFTLVIDERNGDALSLRGISNLNVGLDRSGKTNMTGAFQLQEGSYLLTFNFLRRQFNILPGSTITWTGEPTMANVDITAAYTANTGSLQLVETQLAGSAQNVLNVYKQRLPFEVQLKMKGELLRPIITFDITLPERYSSQWQVVRAKLDQIRQNESELNKQVFALLLLNQFVSETPLNDFGGDGGMTERYIRQSASRVLTDQLNKWASNLIKGFDLNIGVNSGDDYTTGTRAQRTDVSVGVSKRLLDDRLRISVGSNFEVEGPQSEAQQASQIAGDVSVEYLLTKDGKYIIRAYRRNQYQDYVVGQVVETGASFGVNIDYDRIREIFQNSEKSRQEKRKRREQARTAAPTP